MTDTFGKLLHSRLTARDIDLIGFTPGRVPDGGAEWIVTVRWSDVVRTVHVPLGECGNMLTLDIAERVAVRIIEHRLECALACANEEIARLRGLLL